MEYTELIMSRGSNAGVLHTRAARDEESRSLAAFFEATRDGMVVGEHARENDLEVNVLKGKQLTNIRSAGKDENVLLTPPVKLTLEYAVEFIADDELVEVTPRTLRIRKRFLKEHERKRAERTERTTESSFAA